METVDVSKRQQPDEEAENIQGPHDTDSASNSELGLGKC